MRIKKMAQLLLGLLDQCIDIDETAQLSAINGYDAEYDHVGERIIALVRKRAGILPIEPGDSPEQRLLNPRLGTAYPGVRQDRLRKIMLESQTQISTLVGPLVTAMVQLEFAEGELELEKEHAERVYNAKLERRNNGLYDDVAVAADRFYQSYGITRHHWRALSNDQLHALAEVLLSSPGSGQPFGGAHRGSAGRNEAGTR